MQMMNEKILVRINQNDIKVDEMLQSIYSLATISLCLIECTCMQIRAEEQANEDKEKISLMGMKQEPNEGQHVSNQDPYYDKWIRGDFPEPIDSNLPKIGHKTEDKFAQQNLD